jgi:hypothetical protein
MDHEWTLQLEFAVYHYPENLEIYSQQPTNFWKPAPIMQETT